MSDMIRSFASAQRDDDDRSNAPALLAPLGAPVLTQSSPHLMTLDAFRAAYGGSSRRDQLIAALRDELRSLRAQGIRPLCLLIGGSFVRRDATPTDLDALVVYGLDPDTPADAVRHFQRRPDRDLDLRFVPGDAGPVPLLKMGCFFHTLYQSRNRDGDQGSIIVIPDDAADAAMVSSNR